MMKNSKLSKLLVAGVSVAMLTSAFAPMAFAEDSTVSDSSDDTLQVGIRLVMKNSDGDEVDFTPDSVVLVGTDGTTTTKTLTSWSGVGKYYLDTYNIDLDDEGKFVKADKTEIKKSDLKFQGYDTGDWYFQDNFGDAEKNIPANQTSVSLKTLYELAGETEEQQKDVALTIVVEAPVTAEISVDDSEEPTVGTTSSSGAKINSVKINNGEFSDLDAEEVRLTDKITLPTYTWKASTTTGEEHISYVFDCYEVQVTVDSEETSDVVKMKMGESFTVEDSRFALDDYLTSLNKDADEVDIEVNITAKFKETTPNAIQINKITNLNLAGSAKFVTVNADGEEDDATKPDGTTIIGVTPTDKGALVALKEDNVVVRVGKNYTLPSLKLVKDADNKDVENVVFLRWEVKTTPNVLADGVTKATGYVFKNNVVDASAFKATAIATATQLDVVPVFEVKAAASTDVITTEPAFQTPNDEVKIYKNGYLVADKTTYNDYLELLGQDEFKGGAFYNEEDEVFELYKTEKNFNGKWEKDTTATGIADGIYFENGVQDTKAYGLKKVVGDDSAFVYLVSDGVYKADYQGLWISEDKVWYKLDDGCCQGPANGVFKHTNGWYYNFKDGKMVETNGFELYGKDQYWFDAGECNTTGGARVAEHVDGFFYYVNNGIWDNTFNGELDGHTFVNGFAAE